MSDSDRTRLGAADTTEPGAGDTVDEHDSGFRPSPKPPRKGPGLGLVAVAIAIVAGAGAYLVFGGESDKQTVAPPIEEVKPPVPPFDELLARGRGCLESLAESPNWDGCEAAIKAALDDNPIHPDANGIQRRLISERAAHGAWTQGNQALGLSRLEDAFEALEKVPRDSFYFSRAYELVRRALPEATKAWSERCQKYAAGNKWPQAAVDCGWLMRVRCSAMTDVELRSAPNQPRCVGKDKPKGCWAPRDEALGRLLTAL